MSEEFHTWKQHFINQAKGLIPYQKKFYKVSMQQGAGSQPTIKMVSPTEQIVERAKASLDQPPTVYDPVTGVVQQTNVKHIKPTSPRKKKRKKSTKARKRINNKNKKITSKSRKTKKKSKSRRHRWE